MVLSISFKTGSSGRKLIVFFSFIALYFSYKSVTKVTKALIYDLDMSQIYVSQHRLLIDEGGRNISSSYYRHATSYRNSSYPFISGDTFRAFSDYIFDEGRRDNLQSVRYGDIVFVKADMFHQFFGGPYKSINNYFVLVTHNSDASAPREYASKLEDEKIIAWYASNPDIQNHSKVFPIPIGLANTRWSHGKLNRFMHGFRRFRKPWENRTTLLYVNFGINTNPDQRRAASSQATKFNNAQVITTKISHEAYLAQIGNSKFVLSPPGNGLDCHRTWEALLMGAAPVLLSSGLDPLFNKIPAVIVKRWSDLTENYLLSYNFSEYDNLIPVVLYARYWRKRLQRHRYRYSKYLSLAF